MAVNGSEAVRQLSQLELMGHLFRRAGFGATRDELEVVLAKGYEATLQELLHPERVPDLEEDLLFRSFPDFHETRKVDVAVAAWVWRMIHTQRPLEEKMVLFWHCLFATGNAKVESPLQMASQIATFRRVALSDFRTILLELSKDPAMLFWLDNQLNTKDVHNENYGRELLELFSMGIGTYTEDDVKECARAFTGWTFKEVVPGVKPYGRFRWAFEFHPERHDDGEKEILGERGPFDGADIIDIIVRQPATGRFLAKRLYLFFVADHPDPDAIEYLASVYHESHYDIRAMLRALFMSPFFRSERAYYAKVKSPAEHVVGIMRLVGDYASPKPGFGEISLECRYMGQDLLNPPSVEGWHTGKEWIDTGCLVERVNFGAKQLGDVSKPGVQRIIERLRAQGELSPEHFVDGCLGLLGPLTLNAKTRAALVKYVSQGGSLRLNQGNHAADQRVGELLSLIAATREFQMA
ncbi:MAG: DUF1800 domain-containing protein [Candidatus Entotheonellia bacterium]